MKKRLYTVLAAAALVVAVALSIVPVESSAGHRPSAAAAHLARAGANAECQSGCACGG
jgi:hypothetical protein